MTTNPYLRRLLGEAAEEEAAVEQETPQELLPPPADDTPEQPPDETVLKAAPTTQELVQQWQRGEHMGVAARLMFTEASYADFVDLVFILGHEAGRELGELLDELADTQGIEPPQTPPEYKSVLQRVAGADEEEGVL